MMVETRADRGLRSFQTALQACDSATVTGACSATNCRFQPPQGPRPGWRGSMASKVKGAGKEKKEEATPEKDAPETPDTPLPLLDLSDAAVRKMIKAAKKRGYVTHDQVIAVLPSEVFTSFQI